MTSLNIDLQNIEYFQRARVPGQAWLRHIHEVGQLSSTFVFLFSTLGAAVLEERRKQS